MTNPQIFGHAPTCHKHKPACGHCTCGAAPVPGAGCVCVEEPDTVNGWDALAVAKALAPEPCPDRLEALHDPEKCAACTHDAGFRFDDEQGVKCAVCGGVVDCDPLCNGFEPAVKDDQPPRLGPCETCGLDHETEDHEEGTIGPLNHEHSSGCWPGNEDEFDCPLVSAFHTMREALRSVEPYLSTDLEAAVREALTLADLAAPRRS